MFSEKPSPPNPLEVPSGLDPADLRALGKLVNQSIETIIAEYTKVEATVPSLSTLTPGPFDTPDNRTTALEDAVRSLEGACGQLSATCMSPGYTLANRAMAMYQAVAINLVVETRVADHLGDDAYGLPVSILAKKTGVDEDKLARIMRFLATTHVFTEVKPDVFSNNRLSYKMRSCDALSSSLGHWTGECFASAAAFTETLMDPEWTSELSPERAPFYRAFNQVLFEYYASAEGKKRGERFNRAMLGWGQISGTSGLLSRVYPWSAQPAGAVVCDIGGGNGHVTLGLLKEHNHLHAIIQDLPLVLEDAKKLWKAEYPTAIDSQRVTFKPIDFLKEGPVKDCAIYYMRHIIHDWSNPDSVIILKGIRGAMAPSSKLLIQEFAIPDLTRVESDTNMQAPEPLLPNYGIGRSIPYYVDLHMMNTLNARERTLREFDDIVWLQNEHGVQLRGFESVGIGSCLTRLRILAVSYLEN